MQKPRDDPTVAPSNTQGNRPRKYMTMTCYGKEQEEDKTDRVLGNACVETQNCEEFCYEGKCIEFCGEPYHVCFPHP